MKNVRALLVTVAASLTLSAHGQLINAVKAVVHDAVVTQWEVERSTLPAEEGLRRQYGSQSVAYQRKLSEALTENLEVRLKRQLILHDFKSGGYSIPEPILDDAVEEEVQKNYGDRAKLIRTLQAQGMTYEKFRQKTKEDIILRALSAKNIAQEIIISPHRIESYYLATKDKYKVEEEVKLRRIVLNKPPNADAGSVRKLAEEIRLKIKDGAAFTEMASIHSEASDKNAGGLWGWVERKVLAQELADIAFALKPGEVSEVLEVGNAYFVLLVEDRRPAHSKALSEVRDEIESNLKQEERNRLEKQWIERLKKKTFVRYF
jgi:peptidyl-prolyl cis-trans isomerase SurA